MMPLVPKIPLTHSLTLVYFLIRTGLERDALVHTAAQSIEPSAFESLIEGFHDDCGGSKRGANTMRIFEAEGLRIAHLGDIGCEPSEEDIQVTETLRKVSVIMGIELLDHVIVSREGYFSFLENKMLSPNLTKTKNIMIIGYIIWQLFDGAMILFNIYKDSNGVPMNSTWA